MTKKTNSAKAPVTKKVVAKKSNRKEETLVIAKPTKEDIVTAVKTFRIDVVNAHIKRINTKISENEHPQYYGYYRTEEEMIKLIQDDKQYKEYIKALVTVEKLHRIFINHAKAEAKKNQVYGIELAHVNELQPDKSSKKEHEDRIQSELDTMKKELAKINKAINKALKENA